MTDCPQAASHSPLPSHSRRSVVKSLAMGAAATLTRNAFARPLQNQKRPNIIYILADDLGWGDLDCYNKLSAVPTPNANRFAQQGLRFTDMHAPSAVCTPSRYGILTGRYCWRGALKKGVLWGYSPNLIEPGRLTVPGMLQKCGYYTAGVGKWHLGLGSEEKTDYTKPLHPGPVDHGFDYFYGIPASLDIDPYLYFENDHVVRQPTETIAASDSVTATDTNEAATAGTAGSRGVRGVFWRGGAIAPGFKLEEVLPKMTKKACDIIHERAKKTEPFFLYFALPAPHTPWLPSKEFRGRSHAGLYGDYVAQVDDVFGQVLKAIDDAGIADDTLVIITSDNGADWKITDKALYPHLANGNWRGEKADIWEAGHRVPFMVR